MIEVNRRKLILGASAMGAGLALSAQMSGALAQSSRRRRRPEDAAFEEPIDPAYAEMYASIDTEPFPVPAINLRRIGPAFLRRTVEYDEYQNAGLIVVDPQEHFLHYVVGDGTAVRYGVGVGKEGFGWSGEATINSKQEWPDWYPPKEMIARQPALKAEVSELQSGVGVPGGPRNPLGARAMYLWQDNKDTLFRIHGTVEPWSIGHNVSSGCIRMINQDAMDLYERVDVGTTVIVL